MKIEMDFFYFFCLTDVTVKVLAAPFSRLHLFILFKCALLDLNAHSALLWRPCRLLGGRFLLFAKGFSLRTVGILVLAHPTQNLFAQIFPIIPQTVV